MTVLPEGNTKYLLIDGDRVVANASRGKAGQPVVIVVEEVPEGIGVRHVEHRAYGLVVEGPVRLAYSQRNYVLRMWRRELRAAHVTEGRVALAATPEEVATLSLALLPDPKTPAETSAKPRKTPAKK